MKANAKNIANYVNKTLDRTGTNNVAICLPPIDKRTFNALVQRFKSVQRQPFGYISFERD